MTKYFCDICGVETGYAAGKIQLGRPGSENTFVTVCDSCLQKVTDFISSIDFIGNEEGDEQIS